MPTRIPRIGVASVHGHGASHVSAARELEREGRAVLAAVADHRAPGPELGGVPAYHEASEMIASERLDVIVISTPMHTHLPLAEQALAAGAHVLLEKPPTPTLDEFHRLVAASAASGRAVQLGFQSLGSSAVPEMRRRIAEGAIGEPVRFGALATWVRTEAYWRRSAWAGRRALDGVPVVDGAVTNPLAHAVATGLAIAGAPGESDVAGVRLDLYRANDIEADDTSSLVVDLADGRTLACALSLTAARSSEPCIVVEGTTGRLVLWYTLDVIQLLRARRRVPDDHRPPAHRPAREPRRPRRRRRAAARAGRLDRRVHAGPRGGAGRRPRRRASPPGSSIAARARRGPTGSCGTSSRGAHASSARDARSPTRGAVGAG